MSAVFGAWRATQGGYRFDRDLYKAVQGTSIEGDLPV
jgi:hypothetical protein